MKTIIEVVIDWGEGIDPCNLGQEEIENGIHETIYEQVDEPCSITTKIKRWE